MLVVTTTQTMKKIHAYGFEIEVADFKGQVWFFLSHVVRHNYTSMYVKFFEAFQMFILLASVRCWPYILKTPNIDFTAHYSLLSDFRHQTRLTDEIRKPDCCFSQYSPSIKNNVSLNCSESFMEFKHVFSTIAGLNFELADHPHLICSVAAWWW